MPRIYQPRLRLGCRYKFTGVCLGDYGDDVHYAATNGDYYQYTFNGTGIDFITEKNSDMGDVDIYIDGILQQTVSGSNATRLVQQIVYSKTGLGSGRPSKL